MDSAKRQWFKAGIIDISDDGIYRLKLVGWVPGQGAPEPGYIIYEAKTLKEIGAILSGCQEDEKVWLDLIQKYRVHHGPQ
jgi:hypothetical protein